jgi:ketosteroid isomerase-like protein
MSTENNIRVVQSLYAAFGRGDVSAVMEALDPNIVWTNPGPAELRYFGTHHGRDAVLGNIFMFLAENMEIHVFEPREFVASGDRVVVLLHMEVTARRTGRRVTQEMAHAFRMKDGRPVEFHDFQNNYAIAEALRG